MDHSQKTTFPGPLKGWEVRGLFRIASKAGHLRMYPGYDPAVWSKFTDGYTYINMTALITMCALHGYHCIQDGNLSDRPICTGQTKKLLLAVVADVCSECFLWGSCLQKHPIQPSYSPCQVIKGCK